MNSPESARTDDSKDQRFSPPAVALPKGGGAIKGIGEKFAANPVTGTGSFTIPCPLSPGRSGFTPALALSYDSGAGNGPYGFGWSVGYPAITRRTDRGLPQYFDDKESDIFILSGAEDLVPITNPDGSRFEERRDEYRITSYRPRIEGLFARIERWTNERDRSDTFWRSISRDNITTFYGKTAASRIADPVDASRIFTWLVCESFDDKGNAAVYEYIPEDGLNVDTHLATEFNRTALSRSGNRYLKRVKYANRTSILLQPDLSEADWLFELVMDYGDHEGRHPTIQPNINWPVRPDPFSSHRSGFEVRTYRRCHRILMFHRFEELGPQPELVRALELDYEDFNYAQGFDTQAELEHQGSTRLGSFLRRATLHGFADNGFRRAMPPVELTYSRAKIGDVTRTLDEESSANLPGGVDGVRYQWLDLNSEGISGVLSEQGAAWWYKPNLGGGRLGPQQLVAETPSIGLDTRAQFLDLASNGVLDLVQFNQPNAGFFERDDQAGWSNFTPFANQPNIEWDDPNLRFVDLTGDGHADVLITEDEIICWHQSLAEEGFGARQLLKMAADESLGPKLVFHDTTNTIFLADMSGDGLTDLVRIRNGEVCYWPNLGYGRFGRKVTMDGAPILDAEDLFEPRRIRLSDIDGSGTIDLIYLAGDGVRLYFNRCGNSWSSPYRLANFPPVDNVASVNVTDLLGNGTACLVWSTPLPNEVRAPLHYVDLMGGTKPHLLVGLENNMGARTRIEYTASTHFYLEDQLAGRPWITRLPFPVHVVERTEIFDDISRNRFVTRFAYHHGYFDGVEREFRGFGMVEQFDTEEFATLNADQQLSVATNIDASSHLPPVMTRTWFHTGIYFNRKRVSNFFAGLNDDQDSGEYYREPGLNNTEANKLLLDDTVLPKDLTIDEEREACRALKGAMLRQEVYALDGTGKEPYPYSVTEQNFTIRLLQPKGENPHAVFFSHPREAISYHYERIPDDPRVAHSLTLEVDDFGNILKSADVAYGRRNADTALEERDQKKQDKLLVVYTENDVTNSVENADNYRAPLACESRSFELTGLRLATDSDRFAIVELLNAGSAAASIDYEETPTSGVLQKRLIEQVRTLFRSNDLAGALPKGRMESLAIPFESYKLAFTQGLLTTVYGPKLTNSMLAADGRYVHSEGDSQWWIPSGKVFFDPNVDILNPLITAPAELTEARAHFFLPRKFCDPFNQSVAVNYVRDLLVAQTKDALENTVTVENDLRVLQPQLVTDPNGNRTTVSFDALGMVAGTAVMGKTSESLGDSLEDFAADLTSQQIDDFFSADDPHTAAGPLLGNASTRIVYDLDRFRRSREDNPTDPNKWESAFVATIARETHVSDLEPGQESKLQISFSYSDGFGREIQKKIQAEAGPVPRRDPNGRIVVGANGQPEMTANTVSPRWVGSGWTIFNNKGKPVRQFEPFFTDIHGFESDVRVGVSPVLCYDPAARVVATLHPNHTWEKVVFDSWRQETWDVNDTVLIADPKTDDDVGNFFDRLSDADYLPTWHVQREAGALGSEEQTAATKAAVHAGTPSIAHADVLGRTFLTVALNRFKRDSDPVKEEFYATRVNFDIEGNQREVIDAKDRVVMRYDYNMLGSQIHQASMEAGERWALSDVAGKPTYIFDSRDHQFRTAYDQLQRPTDTFLSEAGGPELLIGRTVYGESQPNPEAKNQRGKAVQIFDQAGVVTADEYDFKGNPLFSQRQLAQNYKTALNWSTTVPLEADFYTSRRLFDALNRPITVTAPDESVYRPTFNEANLLNKVEVNLRGAEAATPFVNNIDYDAKGQRVFIEYGNNVKTEYAYDPLTLRLTNLKTTRLTDQGSLQDLSYTYDPIGNITHIDDSAQQTIYFNNQVVAPSNDYVYDAVYRLIKAAGREHIGQVAQPQTTPDDEFRVRLPHPNDGQAMRRYSEQYEYDAIGNFDNLIHEALNGKWTRGYFYNEPSLIETGKINNRLSRTTVGANNPITEPYTHDAHGNMTTMPHLPLMKWDFKDQLQATSRQVVNDGTPETTFYVYDAGGQRVRKVTERQNGTRKNERSYLGGFEVFREFDANGISVTLERETLHVMDDKQRLALVETRTQGTDGSPTQLIRYQFANHLGSASLELDDAGQIISYEEYYPYGSTSYQAVRSQMQAPKRYRYAGMERDEESGLNYQGARYYAPDLGRWISCDPSGLTDGINLYGFVKSNPIIYIDVTGTDSRRTDSEGKNSKKEFEKWRAEALAELAAIRADIQHMETVDIPELKEHVTVLQRAAQDAREKVREATDQVRKYAARVTRIGGGLKILGGGAAFAGGATLCATIIGCFFGGGALIATGSDVAGSGLGELITGDPHPTIIGQTLGPTAQHYEEQFVSAGGIAVPVAKGFAALPRSSPLPSGVGSGPVIANESGVYARVPGAISKTTTEADDIALWTVSEKYGVEYAEVEIGGLKVTKYGSSGEVSIPAGPEVSTTVHTHLPSRIALPSQADVFNFRGNFTPATSHSVLGSAFPNADRFLTKLGLEQSGVVMKTTFDQAGLENPLVTLFRRSFGKKK